MVPGLRPRADCVRASGARCIGGGEPAGDGDATINSIPLDGMLFLKVDALRFGAGLTYYLDPEAKLCRAGLGCDIRNFDDALGVAFELRHQISDIMFWGARYTSVDYKDQFDTFDANNLRFHFGMIF